MGEIRYGSMPFAVMSDQMIIEYIESVTPVENAYHIPEAAYWRLMLYMGGKMDPVSERFPILFWKGKRLRYVSSV